MAIGINQQPKKKDEENNEEEREYDTSLFNTKKIILVVGIVAVVLIVLFTVVSRLSSSDVSTGSNASVNNQTSTSDVSSTDTDDTGTSVGDGFDEGSGNPKNKYIEGDTDYGKSDKNKTTAKVYNAGDFIKDLNGKDVSAIYSVKSRDYVKAHVSYTAKRAIMDEGMELYWIDVVYKKKKYRVQVPFYYFKDFDDTGICRVEIEVLTLENGGQIISYMQVIPEDDDSESSEEY